MVQYQSQTLPQCGSVSKTLQGNNTPTTQYQSQTLHSQPLQTRLSSSVGKPVDLHEHVDRLLTTSVGQKLIEIGLIKLWTPQAFCTHLLPG